MRTDLIGLTGRARSGKDTIADMLREFCGHRRVSFADPMRAMLRALGVPGEYMDGPAKEHDVPGIGASYRRLAQTLGTEWGRECIRPSFWLDLARRRIDMLRLSGVPVVVTDVRFENEAALVRELGGEVWHVVRDVAAVRSHASEAGVAFQPGDVHIPNFGTLGDLERLVLGAAA